MLEYNSQVNLRCANANNYLEVAGFFFKPPTFIAGNFAAVRPTETHSTSLEKSKFLESIPTTHKAGRIFKISFAFSKRGTIFIFGNCTYQVFTLTTVV